MISALFKFARWWRWKVWKRLTVKVIMGRAGEVRLTVEWKLADLWVGIFWRTDRSKYHMTFGDLEGVDLWICALPCVPLHVRWDRWQDEVPF